MKKQGEIRKKGIMSMTLLPMLLAESMALFETCSDGVDLSPEASSPPGDDAVAESSVETRKKRNKEIK